MVCSSDGLAARRFVLTKNRRLEVVALFERCRYWIPACAGMTSFF